MTAFWFAGVAVIAGVLFWLTTERRYGRQLARLSERRENVGKPTFVTLLGPTVDADVASWLWDALLVYWEPKATPHPDDDFLEDLPIDPDEPSDWLRDFCASQGLDRKSFPEWPHGRKTTVRNLAVWLCAGRRSQLAVV